MIQDVIELRRRRWVHKSVVDSQPKMMDQIQKEAEQHQRHIEVNIHMFSCLALFYFNVPLMLKF